MKTFPAGNVADMLRGRAAGVNVTSSSGRPGSTPSITIRGSRSISADDKRTEEFASDLIYTISKASELLDTITRQGIALDNSRWQLRDFLSTNTY